MANRIIIFAPSYNPNGGGSIVLHKLCHLLNEQGQEAFLFPAFTNFLINPLNFPQIIEDLNYDFWHYSISAKINYSPLPEKSPAPDPLITKLKKIKRIILNQMPIMELARSDSYKYKTNPLFNTPVIGFESAKTITDDSKCIVIYPEVVAGNPLGAKNVVRWLLHDPGFHTKLVAYGPGELYFRFGAETQDIRIPGSTLSSQLLTIVHTPFEYYNQQGISNSREGTAYFIGKGKNRLHNQHPIDAILIDGKSHAEIGEIFKRVDQFISYDPRTSYSHFAALCGCTSIVVPEEGVSEAQWLPNPDTRVGLAYGFNRIHHAQETIAEVLNFITTTEVNMVSRLNSCLDEIFDYFQLKA
jgi:hypothetical protein